jgi:glycosyltransferase involved in cell wall biosynthesis
MVVDGRSTDTTREEVERFSRDHPEINLTLLDNPYGLSSPARNIGIRQARGTLVGVIDGHVFIPDNQLFSNMEGLKEEKKALCLARPAPLDVPGLKDGPAYWIALARKSWLGHSQKSFIYSKFEGFVDPMSSGFAYDRQVFDQVGFFDESFDAAEDVEFHFRLKKAGISAYTSPKFLIYSHPRESLHSLFRQQVRYGIGRARLIKKDTGGFTKETPIPTLILLFFLLLPLFFFFSDISPWFLISYISIFILYWLILLICGFKETWGRKKIFPGIYIALAIWITHLGLGWGFLKTILSFIRPNR